MKIMNKNDQKVVFQIIYNEFDFSYPAPNFAEFIKEIFGRSKEKHCSDLTKFILDEKIDLIS